MRSWFFPACVAVCLVSSVPAAQAGPSKDRQAPSQPSSLRLTATSQTSLSAAWNAASDNVGVTGYGLYVGGVRVATTASTAHQFSGLTCGRNYTVGVDAADRAGNRSAVATLTATTAACDVTQPATPPASTNLAAGKPVISSGWAESLAFATDGSFSDSNMYANLAGGRASITVDLGQSHSIDRIKLWHYFADSRTYNDVVVQASTSADFASGVTTIFNNDTDNSSGLGAGSHAPYMETAAGKEITMPALSARYVRFSSNGSNLGVGNHYVEVQVFGTSSTEAPSPTPTPTPTPTGDTRLSWAPPAMSSPTTITVNDATSRNLSLNNSTDYVISLGHITQLGGLVISGGRNILIKGGRISIPYAGTSPSVESRRGLLLYQQVGTVHIEGLLIDGPDLSEGIQVAAPQATVQLQNVRIDNVHARDQVNFSDNHPDCLQPWGGVREVRIDRMTCSTDAHGMYFDGQDSLNRYGTAIGPVDVRRYNIKKTANTTPWVFQRVTRDWGARMTLTDVYVQPYGTRSLASELGVENWASNTSGGFTYAHYPATISSDGATASWGSPVQNLTGVIRKGLPANGDFVPAGSAGTSYVSPGYL